MSIAKHAILTVTNDPALLPALQRVVDVDCPIRTAASGDEALTEAQAHELGLILVDLRLPDLDISAFNTKLRTDPRTSGLPLLLIAATEAEAVTGMNLGANDYVLYPFEPTISRSRLRNYLNLGHCIEALRRFSLVDAVTGIANRRRFDEFLTLEWRRSMRNRLPISIVLMDLDHFHAYGEQYGTPVADETLKRIATAFHEAMQRPGDLIASYSRGGFACVLPETDTLGAVSVAERMRAELAMLDIPHEASDTASILTMSVGAVTRVPSPGQEPEELVAIAERILIDAKKAGRNRVLFGS